MVYPLFQPMQDDDPALDKALLSRSALQILHYLETEGSIGLTQSRFFNRKFVQWAAEAFAWPGYEPETLYRYNKVLNEHDLPPLDLLHWLLHELRLIRHVKLTCRLTRNGKAFLDRPGALFDFLTPRYLFEVDHSVPYGTVRTPLGSITQFLGPLNELIHATKPITSASLREALFGAPRQIGYDELQSSLQCEVLMPLTWVGLLEEERESTRTLDSGYTKTPLWNRALGIPVTNHLQSVH